MEASADSIPAATLILFRDGAAGAEHLFVERAAAMRFAGGATVFPGGRVDPADRVLARDFPAFPVDDAAARIAAIRETLEETGLAIGFAPGAAVLAEMRRGLAAGAALGDWLGAATLDLDALTPFARWCPNAVDYRSFDTRFYIARAPGGEAVVDATENVRLFWARAADVLTGEGEGTHRLIFPTRRNLERLATLADLAAARAHAASHPPRLIVPQIVDADGERWLCIPEDAGYPVTRERLATAGRR